MMKAKELGFGVEKTTEELKPLLKTLKERENQGYSFEAADASFALLLAHYLKGYISSFQLISYRVIVECGEADAGMSCEASVKIKVGKQIYHEVAESSGPVGALDHALRKALKKVYPAVDAIQLCDYKVRILDSKEGTDARIHVQVDSSDGKAVWGTVGASENIIEASWEAIRDSFEYKLMLDRAQDQEGSA